MSLSAYNGIIDGEITRTRESVKALRATCDEILKLLINHPEQRWVLLEELAKQHEKLKALCSAEEVLLKHKADQQAPSFEEVTSWVGGAVKHVLVPPLKALVIWLIVISVFRCLIGISVFHFI